MENLCRLCAKKKSPKQLIYNIEDPVLCIEQKLIDCCQWNLLNSTEYDGLPKKICNICFQKLENSWKFAENVANAQCHLLSLIDGIQSNLPPIEYVSAASIKVEPIEEEECYGDVELNEFRGEKISMEQIQSIETNKSTSESSNEPNQNQTPEITSEKIDGVLQSNDTNNDDINDDVDFHDNSDEIETNTNQEESVIKKKKIKRYDARNIDFEALRKKRLQKLPGSTSRLCSTCGKEFASNDALRRHNLIHLGQAPHECKTCGKRFRTKYNLRVRNMIYHSKKQINQQFKLIFIKKNHQRIIFICLFLDARKYPYGCQTICLLHL